jgi:hypothetical protein
VKLSIIHKFHSNHGAQRAQPVEREGRVAVDMLPRLEVIADEHRIESDGFRLAGEVEQLCRRELFGRRLVSELDPGGPVPCRCCRIDSEVL